MNSPLRRHIQAGFGTHPVSHPGHIGALLRAFLTQGALPSRLKARCLGKVPSLPVY